MEAGKLVLEEPEKAGGGGQQPWTRGDTVRRVFTVETTTLLLWLHQDQETLTWTERRRGLMLPTHTHKKERHSEKQN